MRTARLFRFGIALATACSLAACNSDGDGSSAGGAGAIADQSTAAGGASGSQAPAGTPARTGAGTAVNAGNATAVGTVSGFGSVIIDGVRFDDSAATVELENEPGVAVRIESRALRIGQRTTVQFDGNERTARARTIRVESEITGVVDSVDAPLRRLVVAGQDVRTNADTAAGPVTAFDGFASLADVKPGDRIEVHGTPKLDATANRLYVQATRIERKVDPTPFTRITGTIRNLSGRTFELGGLRVNVAETTRLVPANAQLANDMRVVVWTDGAVSAGTLDARALRVKGRITTPTAWIAGAITDCTANCTASFKVNGLDVDATRARFANGTAATLANGTYVRVRGDVDGATGKVVATQVVFRAADELELELYGTISGYTANTGAANFSVRGVPVQQNPQTRLAGCPAALVDGLAVRIAGRVAGNVLTAGEVRCLPTLDNLHVEIRGTVGRLDAGTRTFELTSLPGLAIGFDPASTRFADGTAAQLVVGAFVEIEGTVRGRTLTATEIEFKPTPSAGERPVRGMVFDYDSRAGTFKIGALTLQLGSAALPAGFADGVRVEVQYTSANGVNTATRIRLEPMASVTTPGRVNTPRAVRD